MDLDAEKLRRIVTEVIEEKPHENLGRPLNVSFGAIAGITKRALALYTGYTYERIRRVGESYYIEKSDHAFVSNSIKKQRADLVAVPLLLHNILFKTHEDQDIGIATIEGKKPDSPDYPLYDHIFYVSYNGKNLEKQRAIASALNDPHVKEALSKIGFQSIEKEDRNKIEKELSQNRPDLYKRL